MSHAQPYRPGEAVQALADREEKKAKQNQQLPLCNTKERHHIGKTTLIMGQGRHDRRLLMVRSCRTARPRATAIDCWSQGHRRQMISAFCSHHQACPVHRSHPGASRDPKSDGTCRTVVLCVFECGGSVAAAPCGCSSGGLKAFRVDIERATTTIHRVPTRLRKSQVIFRGAVFQNPLVRRRPASKERQFTSREKSSLLGIVGMRRSPAMDATADTVVNP